MGYTEKYLNRANLQFIREFLMHGSSCMELESGSFEERIETARRILAEQLSTFCPDTYEEVIELINNYSVIVEEVFMEIGIRAGVRLMSQTL